MSRLFGLLCVLGALCACVSSCDHGCKDGKCKPVNAAARDEVAIELPRSFVWQQKFPHQDWLYEGDALIGAWDHRYSLWIPWVSGEWGPGGGIPPTDPPIKTSKPTGARFDKLPSHETITSGGFEISRSEVDRLFAPCPNCPVPDDRGNVRVTIVAKEAAKRDELKRMLRSDPRFAPWQEAISVWSVPRDHWSLECGFPRATDGVIVQSPDGVVLWRQEDLSPDRLWEGLRKVMPNYDPRRDPGMLRYLFPAWGWVEDNWAFILLGLLGAAVLLFHKGPQKGV